jgi:hypothetical protein
MTQIVNILLNTPWWVFALFVMLVLLGVQALRPRTIPVWRLLITPGVFIVWGVISLILQPSVSSSFLWLDWPVGSGDRLHNCVAYDRRRRYPASRRRHCARKRADARAQHGDLRSKIWSRRCGRDRARAAPAACTLGCCGIGGERRIFPRLARHPWACLLAVDRAGAHRAK